METICSMILDSLRKQDDLAAEKLAKRFERAKYILNESRNSEVSPGREIYDEFASDKLLEADEITAAELYFMEGRDGRNWQRKKSIMTLCLPKRLQKTILTTSDHRIAACSNLRKT